MGVHEGPADAGIVDPGFDQPGRQLVGAGGGPAERSGVGGQSHAYRQVRRTRRSADSHASSREIGHRRVVESAITSTKLAVPNNSFDAWWSITSTCGALSANRRNPRAGWTLNVDGDQ